MIGKHHTAHKVLLYLLCLGLIFWSLAPIIWIFISSISSRAELYSVPPKWFPDNPSFKAYYTVLVEGEGFRGGGGQSAATLIKTGLINSLVIATTTTVLVMVVAPLLGYVFGRLRFSRKELLLLPYLGAHRPTGVAHHHRVVSPDVKATASRY